MIVSNYCFIFSLNETHGSIYAERYTRTTGNPGAYHLSACRAHLCRLWIERGATDRTRPGGQMVGQGRDGAYRPLGRDVPGGIAHPPARRTFQQRLSRRRRAQRRVGGWFTGPLAARIDHPLRDDSLSPVRPAGGAAPRSMERLRASLGAGFHLAPL